MLKDITLGQYFPGNSFFHKLDPRTKIIAAILYIALIFMCKSVWSFALATVVTIAIIFISKIPLKIILKSLKPLVFIIVFTAVINIFWMEGENLLFEWKFIKIYVEGIMHAVLMCVRIVELLAGTSVILTYTTSPISLTDGLERLLAPLKVIKLPVHEFSMMMTIALRFIPTLVEETDKIISAQKARGVDFSNGSLAKRAKALIPVLIPLFISAFRRADDLAIAMECRCYRGGDGRTRMTVLHLGARDFICIVSFLILGAGIVLINTYLPGVVM